MEQLRNHKTKIIIGLSLLACTAITCALAVGYVVVNIINSNKGTVSEGHQLYQVCFNSTDSEGCAECMFNGIDSQLCNKCEDLFKQYAYEADPVSPFYKDARYFDNENGRKCVDPDKYE